MDRRIAIFFVTIQISILWQDIVILWYCDSSWIKNSAVRNNCLLRLLIQGQALSELFITQRDPGKGKKVPSLLCIALHVSGDMCFKMVAQKHAQFQLVVSWHSLVCPWTKHTCQLYVMMYRIMYRIVALALRYVSYWEKLYLCSPIDKELVLQL